MISAKVIAHSTSYLGREVVSYILEYPRYIHSELLTHRVFSKNSASSRAIPYPKFVEMVKGKPVKPIWTYSNKGMQGPVVSDHDDITAMDGKWLEARDKIIEYTDYLNGYGAHKQNVNRLLEPWMHIRILLTGTEFDNWFQLRDHPDAHPEIQQLARVMRLAKEASTPVYLKPGQWHVPFGDNIPDEELNKLVSSTPSLEEIPELLVRLRLKIASARCARTSYNDFEGAQDFKKDVALFDRLIVQEPMHASPSEHCCKVPFPAELADLGVGWHYMSNNPEEEPKWALKCGKYYSNLVGYIQLRKLIESGEFK